MDSSLVINQLNPINNANIKPTLGEDGEELVIVDQYYMNPQVQMLPQYIQQTPPQIPLVLQFTSQSQQQAPHFTAAEDEIKLELLKTLEYYFSTKNLGKDIYLVNQMDGEAYVSLHEISKFPKIKQLTHDLELIKTIIIQSTQLELDPQTLSKVRSINGRNGGLITVKSSKIPVQTLNQDSQASLNTNRSDLVTSPGPTAVSPSSTHSPAVSSVNSTTTTPVNSSTSQKCILILREVCAQATLEQVKDLFINKEPQCPMFMQCESAGNESWYVTFTNEEQAQRALQYLKTEVQSFMDKPIRARIKHVVQTRASASTNTTTTTNNLVSSASTPGLPSIPLLNNQTTPVSTPPPTQNSSTFAAGNSVSAAVYTPIINPSQFNQYQQVNNSSPLSPTSHHTQPQQTLHISYLTPTNVNSRFNTNNNQQIVFAPTQNANSSSSADVIYQNWTPQQQLPPPQSSSTQQYWVANNNLTYDNAHASFVDSGDNEISSNVKQNSNTANSPNSTAPNPSTITLAAPLGNSSNVSISVVNQNKNELFTSEQQTNSSTHIIQGPIVASSTTTNAVPLLSQPNTTTNISNLNSFQNRIQSPPQSQQNLIPVQFLNQNYNNAVKAYYQSIVGNGSPGATNAYNSNSSPSSFTNQNQFNMISSSSSSIDSINQPTGSYLIHHHQHNNTNQHQYIGSPNQHFVIQQQQPQQISSTSPATAGATTSIINNNAAVPSQMMIPNDQVPYPYVITASQSGSNLNASANSANNPNIINAFMYHQILYQQQAAVAYNNSNLNQNGSPGKIKTILKQSKVVLYIKMLYLRSR